MPNLAYRTILLAALLVLSGCTLNADDIKKIEDTDQHTTDPNAVTADCKPKCDLGFECINSACEAVCGDGLVKGNEECDDHNRKSFDGCSDLCILEVRAGCTGNGDCKQLCGDGKIIGTETCDDGNSDDGDGCSSLCKIEDGWDCSSGKCKPICGDGKIRGDEACDDGNTTPDDGCNDACELTEGYRCPVVGQTCEKIPEDAPERPKCESRNVLERKAGICADGNVISGDGCDRDCRVEEGYECTTFSCARSCGNGVIGEGEQCDDSNTNDGDGCSSTCQIEPNFTCDRLDSNEFGIPTIYRSIKKLSGYSSVPSACDGDPPPLTLVDMHPLKKKVPYCDGATGTTYTSLFTEGEPLILPFFFRKDGNKYVPKKTLVEPFRGKFSQDQDAADLRVKSSIVRVYLRYDEQLFHDHGVSLNFSGDDDYFVFLNGELVVNYLRPSFVGREGGRSITFPDILTEKKVGFMKGGTEEKVKKYQFQDGDIIELSYYEVNRGGDAGLYLELPASAIAGPSYCRRTTP